MKSRSAIFSIAIAALGSVGGSAGAPAVAAEGTQTQTHKHTSDYFARPQRDTLRSRGESLSFQPMAADTGIVGLNYVIGEHGYPCVSDIYKGSPADKAGLKIGDEILTIDGTETNFIGYLHLQPMLSGKSGSKVKLRVRSADGKEHTHDLERATISSFKDDSLHQYDIARWSSDTKLGQASEQLIDLPFALLAREHNHPTLIEFTSRVGDPGVEEQLKKHRDGAYILSKCKVVRITDDDATAPALKKYLSVTGKYALIPVYQPWLVTVRKADMLQTRPTEAQLDHIAKNLVHNSIRVQVSHAVAKGGTETDKSDVLRTRAGLAHHVVMKRFCEPLGKNEGIVGLGYAPASSGYAEVTQVFEGGPAAKAGLKNGDTILQVNGEDTRYIGIERIQAELTGPIGGVVKIAYKSGTSGEKTAQLKYVPVSKFHDPNLSKIYVSTFKPSLASRPEDSDEFDVPCLLLAQAKDKPTIFEICDKADMAGVKDLVNKLNASNKYSTTDVQVIRFTPDSEYFENLRKYFNLKSSYACLPLYLRSHHKTIKASQIETAVPGEADMERTFRRLFPKQHYTHPANTDHPEHGDHNES